jgi:hypothetical protein
MVYLVLQISVLYQFLKMETHRFMRERRKRRERRERRERPRHYCPQPPHRPVGVT